MYLTSENQNGFEKKVTLAYYLTYVSEGLVSSIFGPAMVYFAARTDSTMAQMSSILLFYNLGFILSSLTFVRLYDKHPGNRLIAFCIAIMSVVLLGLCGVQNRVLLFLLSHILGLAVGMIENGPNILFPWLLGEHCARPLNLVYLFYAVGAFVTPMLVGGALERGNNLTPVFLMLAAVILAPAAFLFSLPSPRPQEKTQGAEETQESSGLLRTMLVFGLLLFFSSGGLSLFSSWTSTVLIYSGMADESMGARMGSLIWGGSFIGRLLAAWLAEKVPLSKIVSGCLLLSLLSAIALFFCRGSLLAAGICVLVFGSATGPMIANLLTMMKQQGLMSAKINGIAMAFNQAGYMSVPLLFGKFFGDSHNSFVPFTVITLIAVAVQLVLYLFMPKKEA